jgi:hypothetical protein
MGKTPWHEKEAQLTVCARLPSIVMAFISPIWRSYYDIHINAEAAFASSSSSFSLSTLEVANNPGMSVFALTERKQPDLWRWATISAEGPIVEEGWETTQAGAKVSAINALQHHR